MKRALSGIKPSGEVTLGNYLGAMKRWAEEQAGRENFYFIPNLHALTVRQEPAALREQTLAAIAWLLAVGVDPERSTLYMQSSIPAHSELMWILTNYVTMGELNRMTQFKDKSQKAGAEGQLVGLYSYPVLMAADILLYDVDEVPVGEDQKQHVELARDIATRFNNLYGETFKLPVATVQKAGARIMNLQDPKRKMSKSDEDNSGCILLSDSEEQIQQKIMRAVTDSGSSVAMADDKPAISNLLVIFSLVSGRTVEELERHYAGRGYGDFKRDLATAVLDELTPVKEKYRQLMANQDELLATMKQGGERAGQIANKKLDEVKQKIGLL